MRSEVGGSCFQKNRSTLRCVLHVRKDGVKRQTVKLESYREGSLPAVSQEQPTR